MKIDRYLKEAIRLGASDLHVTVNSPPVARVYGKLVKLDGPHLMPPDTEHILMEILKPEDWERFQTVGDLDFSYSAPEMGRFRISCYRQRGSVVLAVRLIPHAIPSREQLGIPAVCEDLATKARGLLLVAGPDGSGKSTTAAALIDVINSRRGVHVITVEDPIEYLHSHKKAIIHQREIGIDTSCCEEGLRSALRQDPDVIFLSTIEGPKTARLALTGAETGRLVIAALPIAGIQASIQFFYDILESQAQRVKAQLASVLQGIITQELFERSDRPGRVAAFEVLVATRTVRNLIKEGNLHQIDSAIQTGGRHGMRSMEMSLRDLCAGGVVSQEVYTRRIENGR